MTEPDILMSLRKIFRKKPPTRDASRRGVALLIVIGLLAVLLIMGVSFSVYMRIERAGSSNYRHGAEARHMLQAALARAAEAIDEAATNYYPRFQPTTEQVPADAPFRNHVMVSEGVDISAQVLSQAALKYVPEDLRQAVRTANPQWQAITDNDDNAIGRCAFIIVNNSGLLDANEVGGAERGMGLHPAEIQLDPELLDELLDVNTFTNTRANTYGRFTTMTELRNLAEGFEEDDYFNPPVNRNAHFETYSRFLDRVPTNDVEKVLLRWDPNRQSIEDADAVRNALNDAGMDDQIFLDFSTRALNNYMSPGVVPPPMLDSLQETPWYSQNVQTPNTKPVPMLYEFSMVHLPGEYIEIQTTPNADGVFEVTVHFMYWLKFMYPADFVSGDYEATLYLFFAPEADCNIPMPATGGQGRIGDPGTRYIQTFPITLTSPSGEIYRYPMAPDPGSPEDLTVTLTVEDPATWTPKLKYKVIPRVEVRLRNSGEVVNQVPGFGQVIDPNPPNNAYDLLLEINSDDSATMHPVVSCLDPRFNWRTDGFMTDNEYSNPFWKYYDNELMFPNVPSFYTREYFADPHKFMENPWFGYWPDFVAQDVSDAGGVRGLMEKLIVCSDPDRAGLRSVGELGFIPIMPWLTIQILEREIPEGNSVSSYLRDPIRVFEHFTLEEDEALEPVAGLVNINTVHTNVLASVFRNMPLYEWKEDPADRLPLTADQARDLAALVIRYGPYSGVEGIGRIPRSEFDDILGERSKFAVEAVLRNAYYLMGWRQQFFTIIMRADAFAPSFGFTGIERGSVLSTGLAIAQIWRDPIPDEITGRHPMFVRYFKALNE